MMTQAMEHPRSLPAGVYLVAVKSLINQKFLHHDCLTLSTQVTDSHPSPIIKSTSHTSSILYSYEILPSK